MTDKPRRLWPWIVAALIGLPVLYVASFGPVCRFVNPTPASVETIVSIYRPIFAVAFEGPSPVRIALCGYAGIPVPTATGREVISFFEVAYYDR